MVVIAMTMLVSGTLVQNNPALIAPAEDARSTVGDLIPAPSLLPDDPFGATGQFFDADKLKAVAPPPGVLAPIGQAGAPADRATTMRGRLGVPGIVLDAYRVAATRLAITNPRCHLTWSLLAGIGRIESGHARGGLTDPSGTTLTPILGPRLSGGSGTALILDTDRGLLDGDTTYDRAVGPMQFIPSSWSAYGVDGNGDGRANPHNVYDAATAAGRYLCSGNVYLTNPQQRYAAVFRYNHSDAYVTTVLAWADAYERGGSAIGPLPVTSPVQALVPLLPPAQQPSAGPLALNVLPLPAPSPPSTPAPPSRPATNSTPPPTTSTPPPTPAAPPPTTSTQPPPTSTEPIPSQPSTTASPPPPSTTPPPLPSTPPPPSTTVEAPPPTLTIGSSSPPML
jgi:hypothetical protein